ncbi:hypothetical protein SEA_NOSLEEP_74 [Mycobacterium phage NoSleep]|nr:hypothetical protein SEA_NOSLEEP_74 [Mycobacterium phage NoSleep]
MSMSEPKPFRWVIQRIKELAAENPERVAHCQYFTVESDGSTQPCCIVGHALAEAGIRQEDGDGYHYIGNDTASTPAGTLAGQLPWAEFGFESPAVNELRWVSLVQHLQDGGYTWSEAVEGAGDI